MPKIGLMGCGKVADYGHLPAIKACPEWELTSIFEPDPERRKAAQEKFDVPNAFDEVEAFFASGIDAVSLTSPAPFHAQNVADAARHGVPILCEKPLAMSEAEAEAMIAEAGRAGVPLYTGFTYRFGEEAQKIKELLAEGAVGDVLSLRLIYIWNCHGRYSTDAEGRRIEQPRRAGRMLEGGPLVDCGVHQVDLARWWTGSEVVRQQGMGAWLEGYEAPDHAYAHLDHANGAHTMVEISYSYNHTSAEPLHLYTYDLIGKDGVIRYDRAEECVEVRNTSGTERYPVHGGKNFISMYRAFAKAVEQGEPGDLASALDGLIATRITRLAVEEAVERRLAPSH